MQLVLENVRWEYIKSIFPGATKVEERDSRLSTLLTIESEKISLFDPYKNEEEAITVEEAVFRTDQGLHIALGLDFLFYLLHNPDGRAVHESLMEKYDLREFDLLGSVVHLADGSRWCVRVDGTISKTLYTPIPFSRRVRRPALVYHFK